MTLLIVAMSDSIHTARWLSQFAGTGWDIHLFPSMDDGRVHRDIRDVTVHHSVYGAGNSRQASVRIRGIPVYFPAVAAFSRRLLKSRFPRFRENQLARIIMTLRPDIVHSLEIQHAGYLALAAKRLCQEAFPPWIVTNWGSDISLFGRLANHRERIKEVLARADFYSCECERDVCLARAFGFSGEFLPVLPNSGGIDISLCEGLRQPGPVSTRRVVMLKGYQTWSGRALVALRSLARCADQLAGYTIAIYKATPDVELAAELFQEETGIPTEIIPVDSSHRDLLAWHGRARISIGLGISDGISTSLLEALTMGAFPVQSWASCADEWIEDGVNGLLVPPEDPEIVEKAIRKALADDALVDRAAEQNDQLAREQLDYPLIRDRALSNYCTVMERRLTTKTHNDCG